MILQLVAAVAAAWFLYNGYRVVNAARPAVEVGYEVTARCPSSFAYRTYLQVENFYRQMSPAHLKYEWSPGDTPEAAVIEVWETAGFQAVRHRYRVTEAVADQRLRLVSDQSRVRVLGIFRGTTRSEVEFDFHTNAPALTCIGLKINIVFPNRLRHLLARLCFTEAIWQAHAREEMVALARIIEARYQPAPA